MLNYKKVNIFYTAFFTLLFCNSVFSQCWTKIDAGAIYTMAILPDGSLWGWGLNNFSQLGDGTSTDRYIPVQIGTDTDWLKISAGQRHTLAIKSNGTLWAWGSNVYGQLGDGTNINKNVPVQIGTATNWEKIQAGDYHSLAIKTDGSLWAWGNNEAGGLGIGNTTNKNSPTRVGLLTNWSSLSSGLNSSAAIKNDGTMWVWGYNTSGQLGDGTTSNKYSPIQLGIGSSWQAVSMGDVFTIALKSDGTIWGCGHNFSGEIGLGVSGGNVLSLNQIGTDTNWEIICASSGFTKAIKTDGTLWAWGTNGSRAFGITTVPYSYVPIQIGTDFWQSVTAGFPHSFQVKTDGTLWGCGAQYTLGTGSTSSNTSPILTLLNCPIALGLEENEQSKTFALYPNPAIDRITIMNKGFQMPDKISIIDLTAKELIVTYDAENIDIGKLSSGIYILQIQFEGKSENHKFIKQ